MEQVVRAILLDEKNRILLVKHSSKILWALPGGHIENGENMYEALHREISEEFNLRIKILGEMDNLQDKRANLEEFPKPISVYKISFFAPIKKKNLEKMEYIFLAKIISGEMKVDENEIFEYKFFEKDEVLEKKDEIYVQIVDLVGKYVKERLKN